MNRVDGSAIRLTGNVMSSGRRIPDHAVRFVQNEVIVDIGDPCQPSVAFELRLELVDRVPA